MINYNLTEEDIQHLNSTSKCGLFLVQDRAIDFAVKSVKNRNRFSEITFFAEGYVDCTLCFGTKRLKTLYVSSITNIVTPHARRVFRKVLGVCNIFVHPRGGFELKCQADARKLATTLLVLRRRGTVLGNLDKCLVVQKIARLLLLTFDEAKVIHGV